MEGCFRYTDMADFFDIAVGLIRAFATDTYADPTTVEPVGGWQLVKTYEVNVSGCGEMDHTAYAYCGVDDTIVIGMDQLWAFYILQGDAAAVIGLAHEFGHALQMRAGVLALEATQANAIAIENQADCLAGSFTRWADENGLLAEDDLEDIDLLLVVIASSEDDPNRDHGTLQERADSFILGLRQGIFACNKFFPEILVTIE
jgi:predicted metalloprotease